MGREQYRTPDADVAAEFERVSQLFQLALGQPSDRVLFDSLMSEASDKGLNWVQGLEYVIEQRQRRSAHGGSGRGGLRSGRHPDGNGDLRRAG
jgi:hypothetical protein